MPRNGWSPLVGAGPSLWRPQPHAATLGRQDGTMASSPTDDFGAFAGKEHMFFGLAEPYTMIRADLESGLRKQVPDSVLERIETHGEAKFLTLGRKTADPSKVVVAHFGFSVLARLSVSYAAGAKREVIETAITFLFVNVDEAKRNAAPTSIFTATSPETLLISASKSGSSRFAQNSPEGGIVDERIRVARHRAPSSPAPT